MIRAALPLTDRAGFIKVRRGDGRPNRKKSSKNRTMPLRSGTMPSGSLGVAVLPVALTNSFASFAFLTVAMTAHGAARRRPSRPRRRLPLRPTRPPPPTRFLSTRCWKMQSGGPKSPIRRKRAPCRPVSTSSAPSSTAASISNQDAGIWRTDPVPFRLELLRAAYNLQSVAVTVSTVENGLAQDLTATPAMFRMSPSLPQLGNKLSLPLSGFRGAQPDQFEKGVG